MRHSVQGQWVGPGCSGVGFIWRKALLWTSPIDLETQTAAAGPQSLELQENFLRLRVQGHGSPHSPALSSLRTTPACPSCISFAASFFSVPQAHHSGYRVNEAHCSRVSLGSLLFQAMSPVSIQCHRTPRAEKYCRALPLVGSVSIRGNSSQSPYRGPSLC